MEELGPVKPEDPTLQFKQQWGGLGLELRERTVGPRILVLGLSSLLLPTFTIYYVQIPSPTLPWLKECHLLKGPASFTVKLAGSE